MEHSRGHKRKISFHDLALTFAKGPLVQPPPQQAQQQLTAAQVQAQHHEALRRSELARRQSKKPTDRDIPDDLADVVVGDGVERYKKLRDTERRLDAVMMRKRLDISDNLLRRYARREGTLRVWISNTAEGQPWQVLEENSAMGDDGLGFELGESSQATFRVKMEGRLLDDPGEVEEEGDEDSERRSANRPKFSQFFKAITIDFHRSAGLQPDNFSGIEWRKPQPHGQGMNHSYDPNSSEVNFDTLEFERKSDENINVTINMVRDDKGHERYKLSPALADILDAEEEDMAGAVQGVWEYCRGMGLQEDDDKRSIVCDEPLRKLFNKETFYFPEITDHLRPHLQPLSPIKLQYTIRVDKAYVNGSPPDTSPSTPTIYDIRVPLPNSLSAELKNFHTNKTHLQDLQTIIKTDDDLALLVQKIQQTNAKRKFYENLAKDPTNFIKRWISSQQRDLEVIMAEATRGGGEDAAGEEFRRGGAEGLWGSQLARESVGLWLARNTKTY